MPEAMDAALGLQAAPAWHERGDWAERLAKSPRVQAAGVSVGGAAALAHCKVVLANGRCDWKELPAPATSRAHAQPAVRQAPSAATNRRFSSSVPTVTRSAPL